VIRWIRDRLGTAPYDAVAHGDFTVIDVRSLVDKSGNPKEPILRIVRAAAQAYASGKTVIVACDFGMSRSNAVAAGALSLIESIPFDAALDEVRRATGETEVKLDVAAAVEDALESGIRAGASSETGAVLVTGAGGFLGSAAAAALQDDFTVAAPSRSELDLSAGALELDAYCRRERVAQILHLAYPRAYTTSTAAGESVTILRNLLDVCRIRHIRLVTVSGAIVFDGYRRTMRVDEETPPLPYGAYGESKYVEEQLVALHARRKEIDSVICRLAPVYGPGSARPRFIRTFYERALAGETIVTHRYRNGPSALAMLYVADAVDALKRVIKTPVSGVFHFGSGDLRTVRELAGLIVSIAGKDVALEEIDVDDETSGIVLDSEKAKRVLGWEAVTPVEKGLRRTLAQPA
jgi:nucleoside-diphosphate-sugar epimerase